MIQANHSKAVELITAALNEMGCHFLIADASGNKHTNLTLAKNVEATRPAQAPAVAVGLESGRKRRNFTRKFDYQRRVSKMKSGDVDLYHVSSEHEARSLQSTIAGYASSSFARKKFKTRFNPESNILTVSRIK